MKPEAGQWWQMKDDSETRCFIVGECRNGNYIIEWKDGEYSEDNMEDWEHIPDCDDFDWKEPETVNDELKEQVAAFIGNYYGDQCDEYEQDCIICSKWKAFRELFELPEPPQPKPEPQPAEDTDEWVIQDRVPVRVGDRISWHYDNVEDSVEAGCFSVGAKHGDVSHGDRLRVWCRRRDLPKVEQAEQWPKYWTTCDATEFAYVEQTSDLDAKFVRKDGSYVVAKWGMAELRKQLTEAEAMELLKKTEPQPQKTRVRLWIPTSLNSSVRQNTVIVQDQPANPLLWQEIHNDSEGFYVENQS